MTRLDPAAARSLTLGELVAWGEAVEREARAVRRGVHRRGSRRA